MTTGHAVRVARVYETRSPVDGLRVLVDRIWPRGVSKAAADVDEWCKDVAPSTELRRWYGHDPSRFAEFRARYLAELDDATHAEALAQLRCTARTHDVTLLTATKDIATSQATVLAERLRA